MIKVRNKDKYENETIGSYSRLLSTLAEIERELARIQREKDLKVDTINRKYEDILGALMRKEEFIKMQIDQTKQYLNKN